MSCNTRLQHMSLCSIIWLIVSVCDEDALFHLYRVCWGEGDRVCPILIFRQASSCVSVSVDQSPSLRLWDCFIADWLTNRHPGKEAIPRPHSLTGGRKTRPAALLYACWLHCVRDWDLIVCEGKMACFDKWKVIWIVRTQIHLFILEFHLSMHWLYKRPNDTDNHCNVTEDIWSK